MAAPLTLLPEIDQQYCPYGHFSSMLARTGLEWWLYMFTFETYWDDSGTNKESPIAVAACYVATKTQWDEFVKDWDAAR
jgi:hypothetical protein